MPSQSFSSTRFGGCSSFGCLTSLRRPMVSTSKPLGSPWVSSRLIAVGISTNVSRKLTMFGCALLVTPVMGAARVANLWGAVALISLATAAHQAFAANLFTLPSDLFPRKAVGSVVGIGGAVGAVGGMLMAQYAGWTLQTL